ncbi:MAG TPA: ribonuclease catalytic domain-containing protein, partial [Chroococcales cyanobacterium]
MSKPGWRHKPDWQKDPNRNQQNQTHNHSMSRMDLRARARDEMIANNFVPDFEPAALAEAETAQHKAVNDSGVKDMRSLLWSSIDNVESMDLDQIEYVEKLPDGGFRVLVGIADVDRFAPKDSAIDKHAQENTTSVYTGVITYPMLPDQLSFDTTSLLQDKDHLAIVIDMKVAATGEIMGSSVYPALVRNKAKLNYKMIGDWLDRGGKSTPDEVKEIEGLSEQLLLQSEITEKIKENRDQRGSLHLQTTEASTVAKDGQVIDLELIEENPARDLIENFMIEANISVSHFLRDKGFASIRRIVRVPQKWEGIVEVAAKLGTTLPEKPSATALASFLIRQKQNDPDHFPDLSLTIIKLLGRGEYTVEVPGQKDEGHFALATRDYTHATAPNRRYPDLITQRLIKAALAAQPSPYSVPELGQLAKHCTEREEASNRVERTMRKVAAAVLLSKHIGEIFDAFVTGVKPDAT